MPVQQNRLELDSNVRRSSKGTALIGGSPFRVVRLSNAGAELVDRWLAGEGTEPTEPELQLRDRLLDAGMVHPVVSVSEDRRASLAVGFVVPVLDDVAGLSETVHAVRSEFATAVLVVVDDGSVDGEAIERVAQSHDAHLIRHGRNLGPAAARNSGWRWLRGRDMPVESVIFLDADVVPAPGACATLLEHFSDPRVAAVAARVRARPGPDLIDRYEVVESPLDLGPDPALVRPGARVPYVPTAALAIRLDTLVSADGFDQTMRVGEDVDLIWRLTADRDQIRYEPAAVAHHRNRTSIRRLAGQRLGYGSASGPLAARHSGRVAPIELPVTTAAAWTMAVLGGPKLAAVGLLTALAEAAGLKNRLDGTVDDPLPEAARLTVMGHGHAARWLAKAVTRNWLPGAALFAAVSQRGRRLLFLSSVVAPTIDWVRRRPAVDPVRYVALRVVDDAAYCAGVWRGAIAERSAASLVPRVRFDRFWSKS